MKDKNSKGEIMKDKNSKGEIMKDKNSKGEIMKDKNSKGEIMKDKNKEVKIMKEKKIKAMLKTVRKWAKKMNVEHLSFYTSGDYANMFTKFDEAQDVFSNATIFGDDKLLLENWQFTK